MLNAVEWTVAGLMAAKLAAELALGRLNRGEIRRHADTVPVVLQGVMDGPTYRRAVEYSLAKSAFGCWETLWSTIVLAIVIFSGWLGAAHSAWVAWLGEGSASGAAFLVVVALVLTLPGVPLDWWATFRLEGRFGFNRTTPGLWLADKFKGALVGIALGFPLLWLLLALVSWAGAWWWVWGFAAVMGFQLLMIVLYPKLILPLFNKLTPLADGPLRTQLLDLAERAGFRASTIEVMDGSKRSAHANAFFTGFGRFRRIVLFDTLIEQLTPGELAAVLAHEIGHYRCGHIPRMLAVSGVLLFAGLGAIAWLAQTEWFAPSFGFAAGGVTPTLLLFALLGGTLTFWLSPILNALSRQHEYEADAFARKVIDGAGPLVSALRKLAQKNLANLTPHPWFSFFYYSHPALVERERALRATN
jgi:STE24 endopeptidase